MTVCYWCGAKDTLADVGKELDDGKYKMVQCSKCKNAYYVLNKEKMNKPKQMTNEEWFCGLSTEEKAEFLIASIKKCKSCASGIGVDEVQHCPFGECGCHFKDEVVEWLKQPHSEVGK